MSQRVAVIGSRDYPDLDAVRRYVSTLPEGTVVVSGGARGVDETAVDEARLVGQENVVFYADWDLHGKRAGLVRNALIAEYADRCVAFWDGKSRGTMHCVGLFRKAGKPVEVIRT